MFDLATVILPAPVTLLLPPRFGRVIPPPAIGVAAPAGEPRTLTQFEACITINRVTQSIWAQLAPIPRPLLIYSADEFAAACVDTLDQHALRILQLLGNDPATTLQALIDGTPLPPAPPRVPREVDLWQAKAVMSAQGLIPAVESAIAAMLEPQRTDVGFAWAGNARLPRHGPTVAALAPALGLTSDQVDAWFIAAGAKVV